MPFIEALGKAPSQIIELFSVIWSNAWFIMVGAVLFYMVYWFWKEFQTGNFIKDVKFINLSIHVPPENEQSPKVMEEFFNAVHAMQTMPNFNDRFWKGKVQEWISVEIVGIDGKVNFIIRCPDYFKDLVEAHLYAQFPEVEIYQVEDYALAIPDNFKKAGWDLFGSDMILTNKDFYPIRTYPFFEHQMTKRIIDPISTIAEVMNKLKTGEQIWIQFVIRPVMTDWAKKGKDFAKKMMGQSIPASKSAFLDALARAREVAGEVTGFEAGGAESGDETPAALLMPPGERKVVEAIERNVSKVAFEFKARLVYLGKKEVFDKRRFNAIMGGFKQFGTYDMNGFKPNKSTITKVDFFFKNIRVPMRQRKLLRGYKLRHMQIGPKVANLTSESLASVFHIPDITVKAPTVPRTMAKKGSAPANLPLGDLTPMHFEG